MPEGFCFEMEQEAFKMKALVVTKRLTGRHMGSTSPASQTLFTSKQIFDRFVNFYTNI